MEAKVTRTGHFRILLTSVRIYASILLLYEVAVNFAQDYRKRIRSSVSYTYKNTLKYYCIKEFSINLHAILSRYKDDFLLAGHRKVR